MSFAMRLAGFALGLLLTATGALAAPELLWRRADLGPAILSPTLVPDKGIGLAIVQHSADSVAFPADPEIYQLMSVAVFDLETGATRATIIPEILGDTYPATLHEIVVGEDVFVVLAGDESGGDSRSYYAFAYDLDSYEPRYTIKLPLADYPNHIPAEGIFSMQASDGDLLISTALRWAFENRDPLMMVYDLQTGEFQRVLSLLDIDPDAEKGWFGRRPRAPDYIFDSAIARDGILHLPDYKSDASGRHGAKGPARLLTYGLARGQALGSEPIPRQDDRDSYLFDVDREWMYLATVSGPISRQNLVQQGDLYAVPRQPGQTPIKYADPFPAEKEIVSQAEYLISQIDSAPAPFTGSGFPGDMRRSGRFLMASAPTAPISPDGALALALFDAPSGTMLDVMIPGDPEIDFFGDQFDLAQDLVLVPIRSDQAFRSSRLQDLALFRLNYP